VPRAPAPLRGAAGERRVRGACARPCRAVLHNAPGADAAGSAAAAGDDDTWRCTSVLKEWASVVESIADGAPSRARTLCARSAAACLCVRVSFARAPPHGTARWLTQPL
jgi:hypothetical protein